MDRPYPAIYMSENFVEFKVSDIQSSIPQRFAVQVNRHGDKLALKQELHSLTYAQLDLLSNRIAHAIILERQLRQEPIILLLEQSPPLIAAILGILKSGNIYVPLDPAHPPDRLRYVLDDAQAKFILTDSTNEALARTLASDRCGLLNIDLLDESVPDSDPAISISPEDPAYIFYTSGSTGKPKGVVDNHRNVLHNIMRYTNSLRISSDDRLTLLQSCSFSGSVSSLFCSLLNGATVYPYDLIKQGLGSRLAHWIFEEELTIYHSVPAIFRSFLTGNVSFPSIRIVRLEGDASSKTDVELFKKCFSAECLLVNGLGATETGISRQYFIGKKTEMPDGIIPIGYATQDMETLLLNDRGEEIARGEIGEIAVQSEYLAVGYWRNEELTRSKFLPDPENPLSRRYLTGDMGRMRDDGCMEYLGRKDFGLKVRGQRVEPAEVEQALLALEGIQDAVVVTREDATGETRLVAYIVPSGGSVPPSVHWRRSLAKTLPDFMIPTSYVVMDSLPLNSNKKVDRRALPSPDQVRTGHSVLSPRTEPERTLVAIWESLLNMKPVGVNENFFDLGGDSLLAVRMLVQAEVAFGGKELPPSILFQGPTIAELALAIANENAAGHESLMPIQTRGTKPPFFCVHGHLGEVFNFGRLSRLLGEDQPFYGLRAHEAGSGQEGTEDIHATATRYIRYIRHVQQRGPYFLGGYCYGGVVAFEMANQLLAQNEEVALLALIDNTPADFEPLTDPGSVRKHKQYLRKRRRASRFKKVRSLPLLSALKYIAEIVGRKAEKFKQLGKAKPFSPVYIPQSYRGHADVFVPEETLHLYSANTDDDWHHLATEGMTLHVVRGEDGAMFIDPHVQLLAREFEGALVKARGERQPSGPVRDSIPA